MCQLFALVVAVSAMIGKPAQPLTTLEVKPDGHFALDEKKDTDSVNAATQPMLPNSLVQNKQKFERGKITEVTDEETAAFEDEVQPSRAILIPTDVRTVHEGIGDLISTPNAYVEEQNEAALTAGVEEAANTVAEIEEQNQATEALDAQIEQTETTAVKVASQQRHENNQLVQAMVLANTNAVELGTANQQLKTTLAQSQEATGQIASEVMNDDADLTKESVEVSEATNLLNAELTVANAKLSGITDSLETLYKSAYMKTATINKITEILTEMVGLMDTEQALGTKAIEQLVATMRGVSHYTDGKNRAADAAENAAA